MLVHLRFSNTYFKDFACSIYCDANKINTKTSRDMRRSGSDGYYNLMGE